MDMILGLGLICVLVIIGIISTIATIILGVALANYLGLSGIVWWAFVIVFWCVITALISKTSNK